MTARSSARSSVRRKWRGTWNRAFSMSAHGLIGFSRTMRTWAYFRSRVFEGEHAEGEMGARVRKTRTSRRSRIARQNHITELVNFTKNYFSQRNINVKVEFSWARLRRGRGRPCGRDGDVTETEARLSTRLVIIHTLLETNTKLIANNTSTKDTWKDRK